LLQRGTKWCRISLVPTRALGWNGVTRLTEPAFLGEISYDATLGS
jgi:hypothetical protein